MSNLSCLPAYGLPAVPAEGATNFAVRHEPWVRVLLETPTAEWRYLVRRRHPWRQQLYVKGRNLTAYQLVRSIEANGFDEHGAASNYGLPVKAIREATAYVRANEELLVAEAEVERRMLED